MVAGGGELGIDIDLGHARREADRVHELLLALRRRYDLARYEFSRQVRIAPAAPTRTDYPGDPLQEPVITLGTRFASTPDLLLATYVHEQMHCYLWRLGGRPPGALAFLMDQLVRAYPEAPISLPDGASSYEETYEHLVVCWLELHVTGTLIGRRRAEALADTQWGYRWIYRTVVEDRQKLGSLLEDGGILPIRTPEDLEPSAAPRRAAAAIVAPKKTQRAKPAPPPPRSRRRPRARGGRSVA